MNLAQPITFALLATLFAAAPLALADGDGAAAAEHSMTGCLAAGAADGTFRLTDLGLDGGPTAVEIASASVELGPHLGHKVEITGSTIEGGDPAVHSMSVSAMKHLAANCP